MENKSESSPSSDIINVENMNLSVVHSYVRYPKNQQGEAAQEAERQLYEIFKKYDQKL